MVAFRHELTKPATMAYGEGLIIIELRVDEVLHPVVVFVAVTLIDPTPAAPHTMFTELTFTPDEAPEKVPPITVHV